MIDARPPVHTTTRRRVALAAAVAVALFALGASVSPARAEPPGKTAVGTPTTGGKETALTRIQRAVARLNREASTPEGEAMVAARLAKQFRTSPDALRAKRTEWGLGYGEVAMAYAFARDSRKPNVTPDTVVAMRRQGTSWESIAKELGVKVDAVASRMTRQAGTKGMPKTAK